MKKIYLIAAAAAAMAMLASCNKDETVEMTRHNAIGFSNAFVDNSTRSAVDPSLTKETLGSFAVYGFTQDGQIFDGTAVSSSDAGATWTYSPTQYWVEGNTYTFAAVAPASAKVSGEAVNNGKVEMTVSFINDGSTDLLHAAPAAITADESFMSDPKPVGLTFNHQLSKVKFSFTNAVGEGYVVKVTDVKITDAKLNGTLTVGQNNVWSGQGGTLELEFGNAAADDSQDGAAAEIGNGTTAESYNEKLMIPTGADVSYNVTFTAELLLNGVSLGTFDHTATIGGTELKLGYCYDFAASLTYENIDPETQLVPIEFTVDGVSDWNTDEQNQDLEVPAAGA